jgi:hypothetical protein
MSRQHVATSRDSVRIEAKGVREEGDTKKRRGIRGIQAAHISNKTGGKSESNGGGRKVHLWWTNKSKGEIINSEHIMNRDSRGNSRGRDQSALFT